MKVRVLGSGTSSGVPRIDGDWGVCDPAEPRNRRRRAALLVQTAGTTILIDTGPDCREQLLDAGVRAVDAIIWTHEHADHTHGIDDVRPFFFVRHRPIPSYARPRTLAEITTRFDFAFVGRGGYPNYLDPLPLPDALTIGDIAIRVVDQPHGRITSAGLRFDADGGAIGYSTDFHDLTDEAGALFSGVDAWILDCCRRKPHPTHPHIDLALAYVAAVRPKRAVFTHMDGSLDYRTLCSELPPHVEPGYDGLEIEVNG